MILEATKDFVTDVEEAKKGQILFTISGSGFALPVFTFHARTPPGRWVIYPKKIGYGRHTYNMAKKDEWQVKVEVPDSCSVDLVWKYV